MVRVGCVVDGESGVRADPCLVCVAEKVRQIQDKLEEFIQALNKEK